MPRLVYQISEANSEERIDKCLAELNEHLSRSYIQKLIKDKAIYVNGVGVKASYQTQEGDEIVLEVPESTQPNILPQDIPLDVVYEDDDVILVNKPKGMVVHPAAGHDTDTLVNALMWHCRENLSGINGVLRPGIVHRIDMNTTGILIACKNDNAHNFISEQLKVHSISRRYYALVHGVIKEDGTVNAPIGRSPNNRKKMAINERNGKSAVTHYRVLETFRGYTWIECQLETGRTHQIRVHMSSIGHPLVGDDVYGPAKPAFSGLQGQTLHAYLLGFVHPTTKEYMEFQTALPAYFEALLEKIRKM